MNTRIEVYELEKIDKEVNQRTTQCIGARTWALASSPIRKTKNRRKEKKSYPIGKRHHFISSLLLGGNVDISEWGSLGAVTGRNIWVRFRIGIILIVSRLLSSTRVRLTGDMVVRRWWVGLRRINGGGLSISVEVDTCCRSRSVVHGGTNSLILICNWRKLPRRNGVLRSWTGWLLGLLLSLFRLACPVNLFLRLPLCLLFLLPSLPLLSYLFKLCPRDPR